LPCSPNAPKVQLNWGPKRHSYVYHILWGSGGLMTRFGIAQELGAPRECPPYPYTLKIVEAG
jgi:hypothetical protein